MELLLQLATGKELVRDQYDYDKKIWHESTPRFGKKSRVGHTIHETTIKSINQTWRPSRKCLPENTNDFEKQEACSGKEFIGKQVTISQKSTHIHKLARANGRS